MNLRIQRAAAITALIVAGTLAPRGQTLDRPLDAVSLFKEEGLKRSQVMDTLSYLTDVHGPRLTNSPQMRAAADWAVGRLQSWGLDRVDQVSWGPFGRGWSNERFVAQVIAPVPWTVLGFPKAWTPGTQGAVTADAVLAVMNDDADFAQWTGKLKGKIVLMAEARSVKALFDAQGRRMTDSELTALEQQQPQAPAAASAFNTNPAEFNARRLRFLMREGAVAVLEPGNGRGDHGSIMVMGASADRQPDAPPTLPQLAVASEHYGRIVRTLERKVPVRIELDVRNRFHDESLDSVNILAEIPGTDKADEVVMFGAHFDSWQAGTGATDNAAGSAAMMEAMRILKVTGLPMRRTVRLALWSGEEQGLLGSRAYVEQQFGDRRTIELKPAHAKLSAYFNLDNGTGAIRGVYLQGNEDVRPIFRGWMEPFSGMGMKTLTIRNTGSTDHIAFDELGLPGFQFIQDPIEYSTRSHHSSMDLYERAQSDDLMKNAVIVASFVYQAANREELLPRKPLPKPRAPAQ